MFMEISHFFPTHNLSYKRTPYNPSAPSTIIYTPTLEKSGYEPVQYGLATLCSTKFSWYKTMHLDMETLYHN